MLLYAALFHQCVVGPIVRYKTIDRELFSSEPRQPELARGVARFACGLAKKALLANPCGALADEMILSTTAMGDITQLAANLPSIIGSITGIPSMS